MCRVKVQFLWQLPMDSCVYGNVEVGRLFCGELKVKGSKSAIKYKA